MSIKYTVINLVQIIFTLGYWYFSSTYTRILRRIQYLRLYLQLYYYARCTGTFTSVLLHVLMYISALCLRVCVPFYQCV